ncbi:MAG: type II/IV secretion system protein [Planctomycetota bacterium]|nr:MAG: type II/IV secretion system protein [Planctomycetota bacterium]
MTINTKEKLPLQEIDRAIHSIIGRQSFLIGDVVNLILTNGVRYQSSDIHFEPSKEGMRIRYRVDGVFQALTLLPKTLHEQLVSRVKVMAGLISHKRDISQEGRLTFQVDDDIFDFRVSIIPTIAGEKTVVRIFYPSERMFDLHNLSYREEIESHYRMLLKDLRGMIVLTGPSGSGKTTTLYSSLLAIHREQDDFASIVTIEDPVEYEFGLFGQMQVNRHAGMDFLHGLSALMRQDPEVIMIGEIRDAETSAVALRAALTGHLVLTTIHSGNAAEVVTRLLNMAIEPFIISSALTCVLAQRLVRLNCENCLEEYQPANNLLEFTHRFLDRKDFEFKRGAGCAECNYTGFLRRVPLAELLVLDDQMRNMILQKVSTNDLRGYAIEKLEMKSLLSDGMDRVAEGSSTIEEILRVVGMHEGGLI